MTPPIKRNETNPTKPDPSTDATPAAPSTPGPASAPSDAPATTRPAGAPATPGPASPPRERFVLDSAHVGDIQGAFGTIGQHETAAADCGPGRWRCWRSSGRG